MWNETILHSPFLQDRESLWLEILEADRSMSEETIIPYRPTQNKIEDTILSSGEFPQDKNEQESE